MKPDSWMPFYGDKIIESMRGYGPAMLGHYVMALWHYWSHLHCSGINDDDDYMRNVCGAGMPQWARVKGIIFSAPFFTKIDGKWHQKRALEEYAEAKRIYEAKVRGGQTRLKQIESTPDRTPTSTPTSDAGSTGGVQVQLQVHSSKEEIVFPDVLNTDAFKTAWADWMLHLKQKRKAPTKLAMDRQIKQLSAMGETKAIESLNYSIGKNYQGVFENPAAAGQSGRPHTIRELKTIMEAKELRAAGLKNKHCIEGPMGNEWQDKDAKEQYKKLRSEITALNMKLASMA